MMIDAMRNDKGASAVEYAVLLGMIAAVLILAVSFLGSTASSTYQCAGTAMGGNTCVQGIQLLTPLVTPTPSHSCKSQNGDNGVGCFGK
jgi:Flp pilus assembly pilin Flp